MHLFKRSLIILSILLFTNLSHADNRFEINDPWVREGPPSATVLAGYLNIKNVSNETAKLVAVSSPEFETTEMHESYEKGGYVRMKKHDVITIPAKDSLHFTPNGYHLMLMDPFQPVRAGMNIELVLKFADKSSITLHAPVKRVID